MRDGKSPGEQYREGRALLPGAIERLIEAAASLFDEIRAGPEDAVDEVAIDDIVLGFEIYFNDLINGDFPGSVLGYNEAAWEKALKDGAPFMDVHDTQPALAAADDEFAAAIETLYVAYKKVHAGGVCESGGRAMQHAAADATARMLWHTLKYSVERRLAA